jgi:TolA-binding protein
MGKQFVVQVFNSKLHLLLLILISFLLSSCGNSALDDARAFMDVQDYDNAKTILDMEVQADPKNVDVYLMLGELELSRGNEDAAAESFGKVVLLEKDKGKTKVADTYMSVLKRQGDLKQIGEYVYEPYAFSFMKYAPERGDELVDLAIDLSAASVANNHYYDFAPKYLRHVMSLQSGGRNEISDHALNASNTLLQAGELLGSIKYAELAGDASPGNMANAATIINNIVTEHDVMSDEDLIELMGKAQKWNPTIAETAPMVWYTDSLPNSLQDHGFEAVMRLNKFAEQYPDSRFVDVAHSKGEELSWLLWQGDEEGWKSYLESYPEGEYAVEARAKLDESNWSTITESARYFRRNRMVLSPATIGKIRGLFQRVKVHRQNYMECQHEAAISSIISDLIRDAKAELSGQEELEMFHVLSDAYFDPYNGETIYSFFPEPAIKLAEFWWNEANERWIASERYKSQLPSSLEDWEIEEKGETAILYGLQFVGICEQVDLCQTRPDYLEFKRQFQTGIDTYFNTVVLKRISNKVISRPESMELISELLGKWGLNSARYNPKREEMAELIDCISANETQYWECAEY